MLGIINVIWRTICDMDCGLNTMLSVNIENDFSCNHLY